MHILRGAFVDINAELVDRDGGYDGRLDAVDGCHDGARVMRSDVGDGGA